MRRRVGWVLAAQVVNLTLGLAVGVGVARLFGPSGQGVLALTFLPLQMLVLALGVGGGATVTYLVRRGRCEGAVLAWVGALAGALGLLGAIVLATPVARWFPHSAMSATPALFGWTPATVLNGAFSSFWLAYAASRRYFLVAVASRVVQVLGLVLLWALGRPSLATLIALMAVAPWAGVLLGMPWLRLSGVRWNPPVVREALGYGIRGHFGNVSQFVNYRLTLYLTGLYAASAAGQFWLALNLSELLWYLPSATASVWMPKVAAGESEPEETVAWASSLGWMNIGLGLLMAVASPLLIPLLYGPQFAPAVAMVWTLLPGTVVFTWSKVLAADLAGRGHPEWGTWSSLAGLAVLAGAAPLVWHLGPQGLSGVQSASYLVSTAVMWRGFRKVNRWSGEVWGLLGTPAAVFRLLPGGR